MIRINLIDELKFLSRLVELNIIKDIIELNTTKIDNIYFYRIYVYIDNKRILISEDSLDYIDLKNKILNFKKNKIILTRKEIRDILN